MNFRTVFEWLKKIPVGEFGWIFIGQLASTVGVLIGVRILSDVMQPSRYGMLSLIMTITTLGQQVLMSPLSVVAQRFFTIADESGKQRLYFTALAKLFAKFAVLLFTVNAGIYFTLGLVWSKEVPSDMFFLATLFSIVSGLNSLVDSIQNAARHRKLVALHQASMQWLRFLLAAGCILFFGNSSSVALVGYITASILVLVSQSYFLSRSMGNVFRGWSASGGPNKLQVQMASFIWPFITWGVFSWLQFSADRWALGCFATTSVVGTYAILYQFGFYPLVLTTQMIQRLVAPIVFQHVGDATNPFRTHKGFVLLSKLNLIAIFGVATGTLIAALFHKSIFSLLVGIEYRSVSYLLPPMVFAGGLFAAGQFVALGVIMGNSTKPLLPVKIGTGILSIFLSFTCAYLDGLDGVILGSVCSALVYYFWTLSVVVRKSRANTLLINNRNLIGRNLIGLAA